MKQSKLQPIHLETTAHILGSNHSVYGTVIFKIIFDTQYFRNYHKLFEKHTPNVRRTFEHFGAKFSTAKFSSTVIQNPNTERRSKVPVPTKFRTFQNRRALTVQNFEQYPTLKLL